MKETQKLQNLFVFFVLFSTRSAKLAGFVIQHLFPTLPAWSLQRLWQFLYVCRLTVLPGARKAGKLIFLLKHA